MEMTQRERDKLLIIFLLSLSSSFTRLHHYDFFLRLLQQTFLSLCAFLISLSPSNLLDSFSFSATLISIPHDIII